MTDRGRSPVDASFACPFVAYEDDRDARSDAPDPRHRCFAELRPAPRAIAHQQAYCLSSGFATCPTFVDWAQRESARVRPADRASRRDAGLAAAAAFGAGDAAAGDEATSRGLRGEAIDEPVWPRRQEREWATPPPWGSDRGASGDEERAAEETADEPRADDEEAAPPPFLGEHEASDRGRERRSERAERVGPAAAAAGAGLAAAAAAGQARGSRPSAYEDDTDDDEEPAEPPMRRFTPDARRSDRRGDRRSQERIAAPVVGGPSWETPKRFEAYPTLRPPRSMRSLSPLLLALAVLVLAALVLFFVPPLLLGLGGSSQSTPTPSPSASTSVASPTAGTASPSAAAASGAVTTYVVKSGDTMSRIANKFGVPLDQLITANKNTVKDPNKLAIGDTLVIPTPVPSEITGVSPSPS